MKRLIKSDDPILAFELPITILISTDREAATMHQPVAAAEDYINRRSLKKAYRLSDDQIAELNHLIHRVIGTVIQHDFKILENYQSKKSYSYYIRFVPDTAHQCTIKFQFELRDHFVSNHPTENQLSTGLYVKAFYVGNKQCFDTTGTFIEIRNICDEIANGDFSSMFGF